MNTNPFELSTAFDPASIDAIVDAIYETISFPPGGKPDWERERSLFFRSAQLIPARRESLPEPTPMSVEEFIAWASRHMEESGYYSKGFHESEVGRVTEIYGRIAQVFSAYESRFTPEDPAPFNRGVNSIQLIRDEGRWWVTSIIWDMESDDNPIPAKYLKTE